MQRGEGSKCHWWKAKMPAHTAQRWGWGWDTEPVATLVPAVCPPGAWEHSTGGVASPWPTVGSEGGARGACNVSQQAYLGMPRHRGLAR